MEMCSGGGEGGGSITVSLPEGKTLRWCSLGAGGECLHVLRWAPAVPYSHPPA